jgi:hypothetical protein
VEAIFPDSHVPQELAGYLAVNAAWGEGGGEAVQRGLDGLGR